MRLLGPSIAAGRRHQHQWAGTTRSFFLAAKSSNDKDIYGGKKEGGGGGMGMEDAFRQLEELTALGDTSSSIENQQKKKEEAFTRAMKELNLQDMIDEKDLTPPSPESEAELYKDMATELDTAASEEDIVADLKSDILTATKPNTDELMGRAIDEALQEAQKQAGGEVVMDKESLLDNEEIMSEIEKIFDKANAQLLEGLEEIRTEQVRLFLVIMSWLSLSRTPPLLKGLTRFSSSSHILCSLSLLLPQMSLARESAERISKVSQDKMEEEEQRLVAAQANMQKMLSRVNKETQNVEKAIEDLRKAQIESEGSLDGQLSDLKSGGLIKQATLAGTLLFTFRAGIEIVAFLTGDMSHAMPALLQGALAIMCMVGFFFL